MRQRASSGRFLAPSVRDLGPEVTLAEHPPPDMTAEGTLPGWAPEEARGLPAGPTLPLTQNFLFQGL